jgi:enterochelin esterase-like enzyme
MVGEHDEAYVKRWLAAAAILAIAVIAGIVVAGSRGGSTPQPTTAARALNISCNAPALGGALPAAVYLPAGYDDNSMRYPVVYFLHGLPAGPTSYQGYGFVADAVAGSGHRAIVVAPQGARNANSDREYLNWGPTEDWPKAIVQDLRQCIDTRFRTIPTRQGRALIGLSAGGYGAFNIGLRNLKTFAAVESWSGYFAATDPTGLRVLNLGSPRANRKARVPRDRDLDDRLGRFPTFIGFYVGRQDSRFLGANIMLDNAFTSERIPHVFHVYPGGHSTSLWIAEAPLWLHLALAHMAAPRGG